MILAKTVDELIKKYGGSVNTTKPTSTKTDKGKQSNSASSVDALIDKYTKKSKPKTIFDGFSSNFTKQTEAPKSNTKKSSNTTFADVSSYSMTRAEYEMRRNSNPTMPEYGSYDYYKNREEALRPMMEEISNDFDRQDSTYKAWVENYNAGRMPADVNENIRKKVVDLANKFKHQDSIIEEYKYINTQLQKFDKEGVHYDEHGEIDTKSGAEESGYARERYKNILSADALTSLEMAQGFAGQLPTDKQEGYAQRENMANLGMIEAQKENAYKYYEKNKNNVYEDSLGGRFAGNYKLGRIGIKSNQAGYTSYYATSDDIETSEVYQALSERIQNNNIATFKNNGAVDEAIAIIGQYAPQGVDQFVVGNVGKAVGKLVGSSRLGGATATAIYMYEQTAGATYVKLLQESDLSVEDAKKLATDEALASAAIEFGLDFATNKLWSKAGSTSVAKNTMSKTANKLTKMLTSIGISEKGAKTILNIAKNTGKLTLNSMSEGAEEWWQEGVSVTAEKYAQSGETTSPFKLLVESLRVPQYSKEELGRMNESFLGGALIGFAHGGADALTNYGKNKAINAISPSVEKAQGEKRAMDNYVEDEESLNALIEEGKASGEGTEAFRIAQEVEQAQKDGNVTKGKIKQLIKANEKAIKAEEQITPDPLEQAAREVVEERNRTPLYERLEAQSRNNEPITVSDAKKVTGFGDRGAEIVAKTANSEGATFYETVAEVRPSYMAGFNNPDMDIKKVAHTFTSQAQQDAYTAGQQDAIMQNAVAKEKAKSATVYDGVFTENEYTKNWSEATKKMVSTVAKHFGMDIKAVDKIIASITIENGVVTEHEANASHTDGKLEISNNRTAEKLIHALVMHESGHRMEQFATDEWNELSSFLYERAERLGRRVELGISQGMLFDDVKAQHDNAGISMSTKGYIGEIAVRELETIFSSPEEFNSFVAEIESNQQVKSAWGKFVQWLSELIEDLKRAWSQRKMTAEEKAEARKALAELERIKELYAKAYLATKDAVAERANNHSYETNSTNNLEIKINEEYNGSVEYSLKNNRKVKSEQYGVMWTLEAGALENNEVSAFYEKISETKNNKYSNYRVAADGQLIYEIGDKLVYTDGDYYYPHISKVIAFNTNDNYWLEYGKESFYDGENYGYQTETIIEIVEAVLGEGAVETATYDSYETNKRSGRPSNERKTGTETNRGSQKNVDQKNFSLKDSKGKALTQAQSEYFKDSKVRDENGNLLVMYQGASEDFTVFDRKKSSYANLYGRGFYFTKSENHASQYGKTRAYYLNIKHPVSTTETTITKSQLRKFLQAVVENEDYSFENYGYGATVDSVLQSTYGKSDFLMLNDVSQTAIGDLVEAVELFNEINGTDYDGIVLDTETVTFNSEQAKLTTNENPTSNPDINFSLKQPVEETKNLIAVHNMQVSELERTLDLGGLPMPSIAIIKAQSGHSEYGDVSLVFDKSVIDPKANKNNKVYGGDAWTPVYPKIEYKPNEKMANKISDKYYELSRKFGYDESRPLYNYVYDLERKLNSNKGETEMINELYDDTDLMQLYLLDSGKNKIDTIKKETRTELTDVEVEINEHFINKLGADVVDEVKWDGNGTPVEYRKNYLSKYENAIRDAYKNLLQKKFQFSDEEVQNVLDKVKPYDYLKFVRDAYNYRQNGRVTIKTEDDYSATKQAIKDAVSDDYRKWVDSLFKGIVEKSGIRNNLDYFTNSGNSRSWEALHWENNLENVVKVMKSQADVGSVGFFSGQNIWGVAAKDYRSIEEIKADSDRLQQIPEEEYNKIKEGYGQRLSEIAHSIMDKSERNPFMAVDNAMECIVDAIRSSKTKSGILNQLKQYKHLSVTETTVDDIVALVSDIANMPTEYFEAKPKRAVELNEIATAIIPDNTSQTTKTRLDDMGIKYLEYESGNETARLEALNSLEDVKFSLKNTDINTKDRKELIDVIEHLKGEFETTKLAKADPKKLAKMTRDILKDYSSKADYDETYKALDELYQYMANGEEGNVSWDEVYSRAYEVARGIVENALVTDNTMYQEYKHLRDYLRTTPMKFTEYDSVPASYESFNEFRKSNMGRLKFTKDGMSIDKVYQELSEVYPEFFSEETSSADQLERMIDVLDELQPTTINPFDRQITQASMQLANDITSRFFDVPQAKPTFADKAERRVVQEKIKGGKKVEKLREQNKERIARLIESHRAKTQKQIEKARQQRDAKVEKEKAKRRDAFAKMSESKKAKELRARIIRHAGELNKTLLKATDKKHIPAELENAVVALLYNINLESNYSYDVASNSYKKNDEGLPTNKTKAFRELKEVYEAISKNNDYGLTIASELFDATGEGVSNIFDEVMKLSDKKIADMTSQELTLIYDTIRLVEHSITTANKMFAMQKWEGLTETAKAFEKSVATRRAKNPLRTHYTIDIETPITFFSHFGEAGLELFEALRVAQDNGQMMIDEISEIIEGIVSLEDVQKADKEVHEFTTTGGKKLALSKAHIMDIYLLYNRNQGRKHLLYDPDSEYFGKGIRQPEIKNKKIGRGTENIRLTKTDIGDILSKLNEQDKAIADKMQKATLKLAEWGNKACMEVFGYEKFNDPDYWTIKSAPEGTNKSVEKNKNTDRSIKNMGSAKQTDAKATNALEIGGIFDVFNQHASDMICYSSWLAVVEDATKLYNFTLRDEFGNKTDVAFQDLLNKFAGNGGSDYYFNLLSDIQNGIGTKPDTKIERIYTSLYGKAAKAKVMFKATVVAQQPMSIVRAMTVLKPTSIVKALGKGGVNLPVWAVGKAKNIATKDAKASEWYGGWQRALKYAPIAARKAVGGYEINSNSSGLESVLYKPKTAKGKTVEALKESPLWAAGKADEVSWGILWNACEIETGENKSLEKGSEAFYKATAELFNKVINETQVVDGVLQRSQIMRSSSGWIKPATAFKGEPIMALNTLIRAYDNLRYETNPAKRGKSIKSFSRATSVFVASAIFTAFARSLAVGLTGDDDEEYWKKVWKSFSGVQGDEGTWFDYVKNIGLKSDVVNNVNPLSWLPIASEMMSALQGYDVERLDVASIGEFVNASTTFINSLDEEGKNTVPYATRNLLLKFAELTGYSPYNLVRDIEGAIRTTRVETNDVRGLYDMEKWRTKPASNTSKYIDILYKAYSTDNEAYEYIYNDMIENGVDDKKIKSGMETRMKKAEGVKEASDLSKRYMSPDDEERYDSSLSRVKSSKVWKSATSTQRKEAEADLYNYLTSTTEDMEKLRAEARTFGVDETEYTLWQLAIEMADQPKGQKGSGSYDMTEKAEAINSLNLGDKEIAYFFGKGLTENGKEELNDALREGIDMQEYVNFKAATSEMKADKNSKGNSIPGSKKRKVVKYLNSAGLTEEEWMYFYYEVMGYK